MVLLFVDRVGEAMINRSKFATVRRTYIKLVPREGAQWSLFVVHVKENFLLLGLFSHTVFEDAARKKKNSILRLPTERMT